MSAGVAESKNHGEALITQAAMSGGASDALIAEFREALEAANAEDATAEDKARAAEIGKIIADRTEEALAESENRDAYVELVDRVTEAIYDLREREIESLSELNDSINDA
jgi:ribosomal protein L18